MAGSVNLSSTVYSTHQEVGSIRNFLVDLIG